MNLSPRGYLSLFPTGFIFSPSTLLTLSLPELSVCDIMYDSHSVSDRGIGYFRACSNLFFDLIVHSHFINAFPISKSILLLISYQTNHYFADFEMFIHIISVARLSAGSTADNSRGRFYLCCQFPSQHTKSHKTADSLLKDYLHALLYQILLNICGNICYNMFTLLQSPISFTLLDLLQTTVDEDSVCFVSSHINTDSVIKDHVYLFQSPISVLDLLQTTVDEDSICVVSFHPNTQKLYRQLL